MNEPIPDLALTRIDGTDDSFAAHRGKILLVVNTASQCGLTPQYAGLEELQRRFGDRGFEVLGFPANNFNGQEPGTDSEIAQFCETGFNVSFPMFTKGSVAGSDKQPLYAALIAAAPTKQGDAAGMRSMLAGHGIAANEDPEVLWNFEKFLINRDGTVAARFSPNVAPDDAALVDAIEAALAK